MSDSYAQLASMVDAAGRKPRARAVDLLIAATAHPHAAVLFSRHGSDFAGLESVLDVIQI